MPSFNFNSLAMRSSPQVPFARAISMINARMFDGSAGRPCFFLDFHRQKARKAVRCQPMNVSGLTTTNAPRQLKNRAKATIQARDHFVPRLGLVSRSRNNASWRLRKRFSAINAAREETNNKRDDVNFQSTPVS